MISTHLMSSGMPLLDILWLAAAVVALVALFEASCLGKDDPNKIPMWSLRMWGMIYMLSAIGEAASAGEASDIWEGAEVSAALAMGWTLRWVVHRHRHRRDE